ncbi:hypothetical protein ScPMuIL_015660 [Solemya velum]
MGRREGGLGTVMRLRDVHEPGAVTCTLEGGGLPGVCVSHFKQTMRRLNVVSRKQALKVVKELDAFPKIPDNFKETSASGGGISVVTFVFILILVLSEIIYYTSTKIKFQYGVDTHMDAKLRMNIDITVAMRCDLIGADVLDVTGQDAHSFGTLEMDNTYFQLSEKQQSYHEMVRDLNRYLQQDYHAIQDLLWKSSRAGFFGKEMPKRESQPTGAPDSCRVHGSVDVNKVAGNFHITAGKSIPVLPRGHAHIALMIDEGEYNFSHRIDHFSFGEPVAGVISPLDSELLLTDKNYHMFQYFMQVVPTEVHTYKVKTDTYQYSVTERNRTISHSAGSHGVPGIFVKYDLNALKIRVTEEHPSYWQFLVRLCGIVGGVFAVSGMLHGLIGFLADIFYSKADIFHSKGVSDHKKHEENILLGAEQENNTETAMNVKLFE